MKNKILLNLVVIVIAIVVTSSCEKDDLGNDSGSKFGTFTDPRDGITYKTVKIGNQVWMAENLKATKYNDGTDIPLVTDNSEWDELLTPAYCWYDNDQATYENTYGALYNWYTVETEKLCPVGWHVPSDYEWNTLEMALGMSQSEIYETEFRGSHGSQLAANADFWNNGALENNSEFGTSGFDALPGGSRNFSNGIFDKVDEYGSWWSSTDSDYNYAYYRSLYYDNSGVRRFNYFKTFGFSVRCVKD